MFLIELARPLLRWLAWRRRRMVMAAAFVVLALVVIVRVAGGGSGHSARHAAGHPSPARSVAAAVTPAQTGPASAPPASAAAAAGTVNIYSWLPFTEQDLAAAAAVTQRFSVDYDTFTYTESPGAYIAAMNGLITSHLAATLQETFAAAGVASLRTSQRQVSTGTAAIQSIRAFGSASITFTVTATQRIVSDRGTTAGSTQYAVTVTGSGASWQVDDIELASAGNT